MTVVRTVRDVCVCVFGGAVGPGGAAVTLRGTGKHNASHTMRAAFRHALPVDPLWQ